MTWVLVPAKSLTAAKSRLHTCLQPDARRTLARDMLRHVLQVLASCHTVSSLWLITNSAEVAQLGRREGAEVLTDPRLPAAHLGPVIRHGLEQLRHRGAGSIAAVVGDLPYLTATDVDGWLSSLTQYDAILAADRLGCGTNGLALKATTPVVSCFGHNDSLQRHQRSFRDLGLSHQTLHRPGLSWDIDTPFDLQRYVEDTRSRAFSVSCR